MPKLTANADSHPNPTAPQRAPLTRRSIAERTADKAHRLARLAPELSLDVTGTRVMPDAEWCVRTNMSRTTLWRMRRDEVLPSGPLTTDDFRAWLADQRRTR